YPQLFKKNWMMVNDRPGFPYYPENEADTLDRVKMHPVQKPHDTEFTKNCLVIAAFHNRKIFNNYTKAHINKVLRRVAGSGYRPEPVCMDSLVMGDIEGYLRRVVEPEKSIVIYFDSDVHCETYGYPYLAGLRMLQQGNDSAHVAIVSVGDYISGGPLGLLSKGKAITEIMKTVGYDAVGLGGNEFDHKVGETREILSQIGSPVVCANLRDVETDTLVYAPYVIRRYGRRKVAYLGVASPEEEQTKGASLMREDGVTQKYDLSFRFYERVQNAIDKARAEGAEFVIALAHLGEGTKVNRSITSHMLIANTHGLDVVLDGNSHTVIEGEWYEDKKGNEVLLAQTGRDFANIGKLLIDPDGELHTSLVKPNEVSYKESATERCVNEMQTKYLDAVDVALARTEVKLSSLNPLKTSKKEPNSICAGMLAADAVRFQAKSDIAMLNMGSMRQTLLEGSITRSNMAKLMPYENNIEVVSLTGKQLKDGLQNLAMILKDQFGNYFAYISGMQVVLGQGKDDVKEVKEVRVIDPATGKLSELDPEATYTLASLGFCFRAVLMKAFSLTEDDDIMDLNMQYSQAFIDYINGPLRGIVNAESVEAGVRTVVVEM
ncbi:MAG: 5'-nucleotidase C-terminal domain-containing protein, partial [Bacteroidales bacterium]|nr:5'-nucleotidase C-terminal domain-containing protein [Bacteroidales bacterium]